MTILTNCRPVINTCKSFPPVCSMPPSSDNAIQAEQDDRQIGFTRADCNDLSNFTMPIAAGLLFVIWLSAALIAGAADWLGADQDAVPAGLLVAVAGPVAGFIGLLASWPSFRSFVLHIDPVIINGAQLFRVVGSVFVVLMLLGMLPPLFALPAGVGDVAVGIAALYVIRGLVRCRGF